MSIRSLRARLARLEGRAGVGYIIGKDQDRDRKRRDELFYLGLQRDLTQGEKAEKLALDAYFEEVDRDGRRLFDLIIASYSGLLTKEEQTEYDELRKRAPPDPNPEFKVVAELYAAAARERPDHVDTGHRAGAANFKQND